MILACVFALSLAQITNDTQDPVPPDGDGSNPPPTVSTPDYSPGASRWLSFPPEIGAIGTPTRTAAGDYNADGTPDLAVLVDGRVFVLSGPDVQRAGIELPHSGVATDLVAWHGAGEDDQDVLLTVGEDGLTEFQFDNVLGEFESMKLNSDAAWIDARHVLVSEIFGAGSDVIVGVGATGTDIIVHDVELSASTLFLDHKREIDAIVDVQWDGQDAAELAVLSVDGITVYDSLAKAVFTSVPDPLESVTIAPITRAIDEIQRLAWFKRDAAGRGFLQVVGPAMVEEQLELGRIDLAAVVAGDLTGDGSDDLFLSHRTSPDQIILESQAEPGEPLSPSFAQGEFTFVRALPDETVIADDAGVIDPLVVVRAAPPAGGGGGAGAGAGVGTGPGSTAGVLHGFVGGPGQPGGAGAVPGGGPGAGGLLGPGAVQGSRSTSLRGSTVDSDDGADFSRNRAWPALFDFDGDGDLDVVLPVTNDGQVLLHKNSLVDERDMQVVIGNSTLNDATGGGYILTMNLVEPTVIPPNATHLEVTVWFASTSWGATDDDAISYSRVELEGEWIGSLDIGLSEKSVPSHELRHVQLRFIEEAALLAGGGPVLQFFPSTIASYTSSQPTFEALAALSPIRGGGETTPKTGPVFVGGIVPRPFLDPFAPGVMPRAPGGGQVQ